MISLSSFITVLGVGQGPATLGIFSLGKRKDTVGPNGQTLLNVSNPQTKSSYLKETKPPNKQRVLNPRLSTHPGLVNSIQYTVIINSFGEKYPEEDLIELKTFNRIKQYIAQGGIYLHAGSTALFYGVDVEHNHFVPTGGDIQSYAVEHVGKGMILSPIITRWQASLVDTLLRRSFGVRTTTGSSLKAPSLQTEKEGYVLETFQEAPDKRYIGDLSPVGNTKQIVEFRSVTPETARCIPFLRANHPTWGLVFPLAAVPYGRNGYLILAGMNQKTDKRDGSIDLAQAQFQEIGVALKRMIKSIGSEQLN